MSENGFEAIACAKQQIRKEMKEKFKRLTDEEYQSLNRRLTREFLTMERVRRSKVVMLYYSIRREADTIELIRQLLSQGKVVGLPICTKTQSLNVGRITGLHQVQPKTVGRFCLMEPSTDAPLLGPSELELIVLPGLAFDRSGHRLGYGAGYYDRFLGGKGVNGFKLGLAYPFQLLDHIPVTEHDAPLNGVLTPGEYYGLR